MTNMFRSYLTIFSSPFFFAGAALDASGESAHKLSSRELLSIFVRRAAAAAVMCVRRALPMHRKFLTMYGHVWSTNFPFYLISFFLSRSFAPLRSAFTGVLRDKFNLFIMHMVLISLSAIFDFLSGACVRESCVTRMSSARTRECGNPTRDWRD